MVTLNVNGQSVQVDAEPDEPLLWVLRDHLNLTGTKFGCGVAACGACTVHLNGSAVRSCVMPASACDGKRITTIEGLKRDGKLHRVQQAWIDHQVPQCGYCQSGMMITAADLLTRIANPSVAQIKDAYTNPSPHLCRCGTYPAIIEAVQRAAKAMVSA